MDYSGDPNGQLGMLTLFQFFPSLYRLFGTSVYYWNSPLHIFFFLCCTLIRKSSLFGTLEYTQNAAKFRFWNSGSTYMNSLSRLCSSLTLTIIIFHPHRWPILDERRSKKNFYDFFQHDVRQWGEFIYFFNWNFSPMGLTFILKFSRILKLFAHVLDCEAQKTSHSTKKKLTLKFFENETKFEP